MSRSDMLSMRSYFARRVDSLTDRLANMSATAPHFDYLLGKRNGAVTRLAELEAALAGDAA